MEIPSAPINAGHSVSGKVSWFGGPNDPSAGSHTASGLTTATPGIAVYNRATLGGFWRVTDTKTGRSAILKQTDLGPAPWTGRSIDVTYSALGKFGYGEHNFPTDSTFKAEYLGHTPAAAIAPPAAASSSPTAATLPKLPGLDQAGFKQAQQRALLGKLAATTGGTSDNPLFTSGLLSTKEPSASEYMMQARGGPKTPVGPKEPIGLTVAKGGYVHPLPGGFTEGRTDQGVDFSAKPGAPIRAIGNGKVLGIEPNWYKGQPYLYYELTSGPAKGRVVYVAEQIAPAVKVGQTVRAGELIGRYAQSGTGIEMGFGTRTGQTLAQSTSGYTEGQQTPAGKEFASFLKQLKLGGR